MKGSGSVSNSTDTIFNKNVNQFKIHFIETNYIYETIKHLNLSVIKCVPEWCNAVIDFHSLIVMRLSMPTHTRVVTNGGYFVTLSSSSFSAQIVQYREIKSVYFCLIKDLSAMSWNMVRFCINDIIIIGFIV